MEGSGKWLPWFITSRPVSRNQISLADHNTRLSKDRFDREDRCLLPGQIPAMDPVRNPRFGDTREATLTQPSRKGGLGQASLLQQLPKTLRELLP
jgi:hypothetical protein